MSLALLGVFLLFLYAAPYQARLQLPSFNPLNGSHNKSTPGLPTDYTVTASGSKWCQDRLGLQYLRNTVNWTVSYCEPFAASRLSCFWSETANEDTLRVDGMCYGSGATFDPAKKVLQLDCPLRQLPEKLEGVRHTPAVPDDLNMYWYETGAGNIVGDTLLLQGGTIGQSAKANRQSILVKREGTGNIWHSFMEIMSLSWSLDVLQMALNEETGRPYLTPQQKDTTQIIIVDSFEDGPYIELWQLFAKMPIRRLSDLPPDEPATDVILPLAGGSNPIWQGDWKDRDCTESSLIDTFVQRIYDLYNIGTPPRQPEVIVSFVHREGARELLNETEHIELLREGIPHAKIEVVDFAKMTLPEQIKATRKTDVLVGAHGAGLTHTMFLQPGSALVEISPIDFNHKGFRNLAQTRGIQYFRSHASLPPGSEGANTDWQNDKIFIEEDRLLEAVRAAARSVYNKGLRSFDVS